MGTGIGGTGDVASLLSINSVKKSGSDKTGSPHRAATATLPHDPRARGPVPVLHSRPQQKPRVGRTVSAGGMPGRGGAGPADTTLQFVPFHVSSLSTRTSTAPSTLDVTAASNFFFGEWTDADPLASVAVVGSKSKARTGSETEKPSFALGGRTLQHPRSNSIDVVKSRMVIASAPTSPQGDPVGGSGSVGASGSHGAHRTQSAVTKTPSLSNPPRVAHHGGDATVLAAPKVAFGPDAGRERDAAYLAHQPVLRPGVHPSSHVAVHF